MAQHTLETAGLVCPFPVMEAKKAMAQMPPGDELVINFDCTQGTEAIPEWAAAEGYPVTNFQKSPGFGWTITVQKPL